MGLGQTVEDLNKDVPERPIKNDYGKPSATILSMGDLNKYGPFKDVKPIWEETDSDLKKTYFEGERIIDNLPYTD